MSIQFPHDLHAPFWYNGSNYRYPILACWRREKEHNVSEKQPRYLSYLLRLWQVESTGQWVWRASVEDSRTGERRGFASIDALLAFLREQTDVATDSLENKNTVRE